MADSSSESVTMPVLGMTCSACQRHVEEALRSTAGVEEARVDLMAHRADLHLQFCVQLPDSAVNLGARCIAVGNCNGVAVATFESGAAMSSG